MKTQKHSHKGHRQRLKQKAIVGGTEFWPEHEVLELLLTYCIPQRDVNPLAHELIDRFNGFSGVLDAGYEQLKNIKGVGEQTALLLTMLPDLFVRYNASKNTQETIMDTTYKCVSYFRNKYRLKPVEELYLFCLDAKKKIILSSKVSMGIISSVDFSLSSLAGTISGSGAKSFIVMHNHPSGDVTPSAADIRATKRLIDMGISIGIKLDDHIIMSENKYFSFLRSNWLEKIVAESMFNFSRGIQSAENIVRQIKKDMEEAE